jgi:hypothetical protein
VRTYREPAREIPVTRDVDVIIVGGGPAGLVAAIASARTGAKTVLVEQFGYLGGTATASLMACINGFRNQVEPDFTQTVRGIPEEIVLRLKELDGLGRSPYQQKPYPTEPGRLAYSYAIDTEKFKYVTLKLCVEAGVDIMFHTYFADSIVEGGPSAGSGSPASRPQGAPRAQSRGGVLRGVIVENKSGRQALMARVIVDASGDADVAACAGVPFRQLGRDDPHKFSDTLMYRIEFGATRPEGVHNCDFGGNAVVWGPTVKSLLGSDGDDLSRGEIEARLRVYEDFAHKQAEHPELGDARVVETPPLLGIRQTRFIEGEYQLTADDAIAGRRHEDVVAISSAPIISYYGYRRYLEHEGYDIPYRCLVPKRIEHLLVAGRGISAEQQAYESHRSMVPIMAIGQAAGTAAALCCQTGATPRTLDVARLQQTLISQGVELRRHQ